MLYAHENERERITVEHFMNLSAEINYQLSAREPNHEALLSLVLGPGWQGDTDYLTLALRSIHAGYGAATRKIGPLAVLHPLRTAALLARHMERPTTLDLLGALLHDKGEDLRIEELPAADRSVFDAAWDQLLERIGGEQKWYLGERVDIFTRSPEMPYHDYLVRLIDRSQAMPDLLHVKLADRLDNTLDHHIHRPGVLRYNFYRSIFDLLFVSHYKGVSIRQYHSLPGKSEGRLLLSQLFKNAVFLSLLRHEGLARMDKTTESLFDNIAIASIREAQWIGLELVAQTDEKDLPRVRELVLDTMEYCYGGGATQVHDPTDAHGLDGLFLENYAVAEDAERKQRMADLFEDRIYLGRTILTFIATFASFLNDPDFAIDGIDREGIRAV